MSRPTDIVVTTIFEPHWLQGYLDNVDSHGRRDEVTIRIVCDRKTPGSVYEAAADAGRQGFRIDCPTLEEQSTFLKRLGLADGFIPWNSDNRRNIGFLRAWEAGAEVLISIDDDNYCIEASDFVGAHQVVGTAPGSLRGHELADEAGWFNICGLLTVDTSDAVYPRGFPYAPRASGELARSRPISETSSSGTDASAVAVNAGLWVGDPDVDAITRLALAPHVSGVDGAPVLLGPRTWSPINTQNTALMRDAIPAYYYVRMGFELRGMEIDRFGDILSGYFVQKCAKHLGDVVRVGGPVLEHRRTPHNLFKDLHQELAGVVLIEELLPWLQEVHLTGADYVEAFASLAAELEGAADDFQGFVWDEGGREFLVETARSMQTWAAAVQKLRG